MKLDYRAVWRRELRAGKHGQRMDRPSTWRLDGLHAAVCYQHRAEEIEQLLASSLDHGATPSFIAALLDDLEREWTRAHEAFIRGNATPEADHAA